MPLRRRATLALVALLIPCAARLPAGESRHASVADAWKESGVSSGLVVVLDDAAPELVAEALAGGRCLVDRLGGSPAAVRAEHRGYLTILPAADPARLPYPSRSVNLVVADLDALAAKAPDAAELRRIVAPLGATCLRRGGAWIVERIPVEPGLGEWTHADHGPDGNPVSPDRLVSYPRGIQWHAETGDAASNMRIGAGVVVRAVTFWEDTGGGRRTRTGQAIEAREAGSGILRWRLAESPEQAARRGTVHEQSWCLADNLAVGLIGGDGPHAQAIDLRSGTVVRTYDQGLVVGRPLGEEEHKARQRDFPWGHNAYPHGFFHLHLDGAVVQGSSADDRGRVAALDLKSGERRWIWEAAPGQRIAALAADRGMVVAGLGGDPFSIGIHYRNRLVRLTALVGIDLASGTVRWTSQVVDGMRVSQLTCADGGVHVHDVEGATHFMSPKRFLRLDLATGEVVYDNPLAKTNTGRWGNKFIVRDGRVVHASATRQVVLNATTGARLEDIVPRLTGFVGKDVDYLGHCSTWRATANGWLTGQFTRFASSDGDVAASSSITRTQCDEGSYPGYGLAFAGTTKICDCSPFLRGAAALHSEPPEPALPDDGRVDRGPAFGTPPGPATADGQWPTFRADQRRSAFTPAALGRELKPVATIRAAAARSPAAGTVADDWRLDGRGGPLTAPVMADGVLLAAARHDRRLIAWEMADGRQRWAVDLPARLDGPPTIHRGLAIFGGNDGTVTCLRLADGGLAWRTLIAPTRRRIVSCGQTESAWPVPAPIVVRDGVVIATAGRHNEADGGIHAVRLDLTTGAILARAVIDGRLASDADLRSQSPAQGRGNDVLVEDRQGVAVHLHDIAIDPADLTWGNIGTFGLRSRPSSVVLDRYRAELPKRLDRLCDRTHSLLTPRNLRWGGGGMQRRNPEGFRTGETESPAFVIEPEDAIVIHKQKLWRAPWAADGSIAVEKGEDLGLRPNGNTIVATTDRLICDVLVNRSGKNVGELRLLDRQAAVLATAELPAGLVPQGLAVAGDRIAAACVDGSIVLLSTR